MSVASVTIAHGALADARIGYLGQLAGYGPHAADVALGKLTRLWARCTYLGTDTPGVTEIRAHIGPGGEELLVEAGLGELLAGGEVRVCGRYDEDGKDRFGWFSPSRDRRSPNSSSSTSSPPERKPASRRGSAGGRARMESAERDERGLFRPRTPAVLDDQQHQQAPASASSKSPAIQQLAGDQDQDQDQKDPANSLSRVRDAGFAGDAGDAGVQRASKPATSKGPLPERWEPGGEAELEAEAKKAGVDVRGELRKFRDYVRTQTLTSADWQASWRTWLDRAIDYTRKRERKPPLRAGPTTTTPLDRAALERERREREEADRRALADRHAVQGTLQTFLQHGQPEPEKATG